LKVTRFLDTNLESTRGKVIRESLENKIIGQPEAIDALVSTSEKFHSQLFDNSRPIASLLFLGPTGTGKTRTVEAYCEALFSNANACIKIDCGEYQLDHEITKLVGSPPGYLGHSATAPRFNTEKVREHWTEQYPLTVILFDEIEKASPDLQNILLGILDKGVITTGRNERVDLTKSIVVMTSNEGSAKMNQALEGGMGFGGMTGANTHEINSIGLAAVRHKFSPEFVNRLDKIVTFNSLSKANITKVLFTEIHRLQDTIFQKTFAAPLLRISNKAKEALVAEGFDPKYNARNIRRVLEHNIQEPLARAIASEQLKHSETIFVDINKSGAYTFGVVDDPENSKKAIACPNPKIERGMN
jgi:ATP-dependent Clp protease ATP-binding subunit ClpA